MQEAERCQINLITIKDGNMFLSSENSQKGVKNKAALKANNFILPATQGENTIQFHGKVLSHRCRHLLIFYFWKRKIAKIESRQNGALSFLEKALWLVYQFSKEFKNCFVSFTCYQCHGGSNTFQLEKKNQWSYTSCYSSNLSDYQIIYLKCIREHQQEKWPIILSLLKKNKVLTQC